MGKNSFKHSIFICIKETASYAIDKSLLTFISGLAPGIDDPREIIENTKEMSEKISAIEHQHAELDSKNPTQKIIYSSFSYFFSIALTSVLLYQSDINNEEWLSMVFIGLFIYVVSWYLLSPLLYLMIFSIVSLLVLSTVYFIIWPTAKFLSFSSIDKLLKLFSVVMFSLGFFLDFITS